MPNSEIFSADDTNRVVWIQNILQFMQSIYKALLSKLYGVARKLGYCKPIPVLSENNHWQTGSKHSMPLYHGQTGDNKGNHHCRSNSGTVQDVADVNRKRTVVVDSISRRTSAACLCLVSRTAEWPFEYAWVTVCRCVAGKAVASGMCCCYPQIKCKK